MNGRMKRVIAAAVLVVGLAAPVRAQDPLTAARDLYAAARYDEALVMLRISYLERLHGELGHTEAFDILVKLLVPATTMAWYGYKYFKGLA